MITNADVPLFRGAYLYLYNLMQFVGWTIALVAVIACAVNTKSLEKAYTYAGDVISTFQFVAILEIIHAMSGLVKGSPLNAIMQWVGRSNVLYMIVNRVPEVQSTWAVGAMLAAWAVSEVIRYPWYAANTVHTPPYWLTWLRYTAFIPLYPIGVIGEMGAIYQALPFIEKRGLHSVKLPNAWNIGFDYALFMKVVLALYPFLWWKLYSTLLRQRKKKLGGGTERQRHSTTPAVGKKDN